MKTFILDYQANENDYHYIVKRADGQPDAVALNGKIITVNYATADCFENAVGECGKTLSELITKTKSAKIAVDLHSFTDESINYAYALCVWTEALSAIRSDFGVYFFNALKPDCKSVEDCVKCNSGETEQKQSFGDRDDTLIDDFEEYAKHLTGEKLFRDYLVELIKARGIKKDTQVYKPSGISKSVYSRISNLKVYPPNAPSRETVAALCIGLRLNMEEAQKLHNSAGFHLGKVQLFDKIIRFYIERRIYDIDEVNACLYYYGETLLGEQPRERD